jgi:transketolase
MIEIQLIPRAELQRVENAGLDEFEKLSLLAAMCRANALAAVKRAGSGHLGSSFSAMEIVIWLYYHEMNVAELGIAHPERDVYFSSKGHDVPGLYSVLYARGIVPEERLLKLRRLGGLDGHPDVGVPGIEANSGSLGMGISKGRGIAWAKRHLNRGGHVFVMIGDGELQEGQNYEALRSAVNQGVSNLTVLVDHNKLQSDKCVSEIGDLGDLERIFQDFGWHVARCDGHDWAQLARVFDEFKSVTDKPKILIADTIKGRGVSFMEHPAALEAGQGYYKWHAGAPDDESFAQAHAEIVEGINARLSTLGLPSLELQTVPPIEKQAALQVAANALGEPISTGGQTQFAAPQKKVSDEYVAVAYGDALVEYAPSHPELVVLDGDLSADCKIRGFELGFPDRFIENGIAEQDMVSMAAGLARHGLLPVVNSFANFLAARANEQIYNAATEKTKIIYACHYAGLIPAGPGKSHQSIRDISLLAALPNMTIIQPCNAQETRAAVAYCLDEAKENVALRLVIGPSPRLLELPADYKFEVGRGAVLTDGKQGVLFAYGPVMLHEALLAAELLRERGYGLKVVNLPWLNRIDAVWLEETIGDCASIYVLEDHAPVGGLGDALLNVLVSHNVLGARHFEKFGVEGYPACGTPAEALRAHRLSGQCLAERILA